MDLGYLQCVETRSVNLGQLALWATWITQMLATSFGMDNARLT
jgi:hypothetical protein